MFVNAFSLQCYCNPYSGAVHAHQNLNEKTAASVTRLKNGASTTPTHDFTERVALCCQCVTTAHDFALGAGWGQPISSVLTCLFFQLL
jgi:hypothetical protein